MTVPDDIDLLAAEYALGTLDPSERVGVARRMSRDPDLKQAIEDWQTRLSPLSEATPAVDPPPTIFPAIEVRLFGGRANVRSLRLWQTSTAALAALAASLIGWIVVAGSPGRPADVRLIAVLQRDAGAPAMLLDVDLKTRRLTIRSVATATPPGKSYELWLIDPSVGTPRPLGIVPSSAPTQASLVSFDSAVISDATYAVTLEPAGGSPNGQPSGTPLLSGKLVPSTP